MEHVCVQSMLYEVRNRLHHGKMMGRGVASNKIAILYTVSEVILHMLYLQLMDPNGDFSSGTSIVTTFADGSSQSTATAVINNDNIPEGNETFTLTILDVSSGAMVGTPASMQLIIRANDEPHGRFQFDTVSHQCSTFH